MILIILKILYEKYNNNNNQINLIQNLNNISNDLQNDSHSYIIKNSLSPINTYHRINNISGHFKSNTEQIKYKSIDRNAQNKYIKKLYFKKKIIHKNNFLNKKEEKNQEINGVYKTLWEREDLFYNKNNN